MSVAERPRLDASRAQALLLERYGLRLRARELPSERDRTFAAEGPSGRFVFKVAHPGERREALELQHAALERLRRGPDARLFPRAIAGNDGEALIEIEAADGRRHLAQLLSWLPGRAYAEAGPADAAGLEGIGRALGDMDRALAEFAHPAADRELQWDARRAPATVRERLGDIAEPARRELAEAALAASEKRIAERRSGLRLGVIHNDVNDHNLLLGSDRRVAGIIDFGDMLRSFTAAELANAAAYLMMGAPEPLATLAQLRRGYEQAYPLTEDEGEVLLDLVRLRLCLSVGISARQAKLEPGNTYLTISEAPAWALLARLTTNG